MKKSRVHLSLMIEVLGAVVRDELVDDDVVVVEVPWLLTA